MSSSSDVARWVSGRPNSPLPCAFSVSVCVLCVFVRVWSWVSFIQRTIWMNRMFMARPEDMIPICTATWRARVSEIRASMLCRDFENVQRRYISGKKHIMDDPPSTIKGKIAMSEPVDNVRISTGLRPCMQ
jgi:hypothetical protein